MLYLLGTFPPDGPQALVGDHAASAATSLPFILKAG